MHASEVRLAYCEAGLKVAVSVSHTRHTQTDPPSDLSNDLFYLRMGRGITGWAITEPASCALPPHVQGWLTVSLPHVHSTCPLYLLLVRTLSGSSNCSMILSPVNIIKTNSHRVGENLGVVCYHCFENRYANSNKLSVPLTS